jgi:hypothetical protein
MPGVSRDATLTRGLGRMATGNGLVVVYSTLKRFPPDLNRWDSQLPQNGRVFAH